MSLKKADKTAVNRSSKKKLGGRNRVNKSGKHEKNTMSMGKINTRVSRTAEKNTFENQAGKG